MDEREDITDYIAQLKAGEGLDEAAIRAGYQRSRPRRTPRELADIAGKHGLATDALQGLRRQHPRSA